MNRIDFMNDAKGTKAQELYNEYQGRDTSHKLGNFVEEGVDLLESRLKAAAMIFRMHGYELTYSTDVKYIYSLTHDYDNKPATKVYDVRITYTLTKVAE